MNNINFQELFCLMYKNGFRNLDSKIYKEDAISIFFSIGYNGRGDAIECNIEKYDSQITFWIESQTKEFKEIKNEDVVSLIEETLLKFKKINTDLNLSDI